MSNTNKRSKNRLSDKFIRFSIGAKLVTIITSLIVFSLGTIIFLVSYFVREDLRLSAEANNRDINSRSFAEASYTLNSVYSCSRVLVDIIVSAGKDNFISRRAADSFFNQNRQIAALVFQAGDGEPSFLIGDNFFPSYNTGDSLVKSFFKENNVYYRRAAAGESIFLNAMPHFKGNLKEPYNEYFLALYFPMQGGALTIFFSPNNLKDSFGSSVNKSYMINGEGDILMHPDADKVKNRVNIGNHEYVRKIRESHERKKQHLLEDDGAMHFIAYSKLNDGASIVFTSVEYDKLFEGIEATTRRNIYLAACVFFLSIMFVWFFSKSISTALKILANAARKIEGGVFELDLKPKSRDEIGFLTASFQKMSKALGIF